MYTTHQENPHHPELASLSREIGSIARVVFRFFSGLPEYIDSGGAQRVFVPAVAAERDQEKKGTKRGEQIHISVPGVPDAVHHLPTQEVCAVR